MEHDFAVEKEYISGEYKVIEVAMAKAKWNSIPWLQLGDYGRRKFENLLVIHNSREKLKIRYA